jgi:hypothetical protein
MHTPAKFSRDMRASMRPWVSIDRSRRATGIHPACRNPQRTDIAPKMLVLIVALGWVLPIPAIPTVIRNTNKDLGYCRCYRSLVQLYRSTTPSRNFFFWTCSLKKLARNERLSQLISFQVRSEDIERRPCMSLYTEKTAWCNESRGATGYIQASN